MFLIITFSSYVCFLHLFISFDHFFQVSVFNITSLIHMLILYRLVVFVTIPSPVLASVSKRDHPMQQLPDMNFTVLDIRSTFFRTKVTLNCIDFDKFLQCMLIIIFSQDKHKSLCTCVCDLSF